MSNYEKVVTLDQLRSATEKQREYLDFRTPILTVDTQGNLTTIFWTCKGETRSFRIVDGSDYDAAVILYPKIHEENERSEEFLESLREQNLQASVNYPNLRIANVTADDLIPKIKELNTEASETLIPELTNQNGLAYSIYPELTQANAEAASIYTTLSGEIPIAYEAKHDLDLTVLGASHGATSINDAISNFDNLTYIGSVGARLENLEAALLNDKEVPSALIDDDGAMLEIEEGVVFGVDERCSLIQQIDKVASKAAHLDRMIDEMKLRILEVETTLTRLTLDSEYVMSILGVLEGKNLLEID